MMTVFTFILGLPCGAGLLLIAAAMWTKDRKPAEPKIECPTDKLENARRYLKLITHNTSLNHAQRIAHKALKETA